MFTDLTDLFADVIADLLDGGFEIPVRLVAVGANGWLLYGSYEPSPDGDGLTFEELACHEVNGNVRLPINMMLTDRRGEAAHVVIKPGEAPLITFN